jgi:hypothetical protein
MMSLGVGTCPTRRAKLKERGPSPEEEVFSGSDVQVSRILPRGGIADLRFGDPEPVITELGVLHRLVCGVTCQPLGSACGGGGWTHTLLR